METHKERINKIEKSLYDEETGLITRQINCENLYNKLNAKMVAVLWLFSILIALGIVNVIFTYH